MRRLLIPSSSFLAKTLSFAALVTLSLRRFTFPAGLSPSSLAARLGPPNVPGSHSTCRSFPSGREESPSKLYPREVRVWSLVASLLSCTRMRQPPLIQFRQQQLYPVMVERVRGLAHEIPRRARGFSRFVKRCFFSLRQVFSTMADDDYCISPCPICAARMRTPALPVKL